MPGRGRIEGCLGAEKLVCRVGSGIVANGDLGVFDGIMPSVMEGIPKGLQEVQRTLVPGSIAVIAHNGEGTAVGL